MVFVLSNTNKKLMPTNEYRARKLRELLGNKLPSFLLQPLLLS